MRLLTIPLLLASVVTAATSCGGSSGSPEEAALRLPAAVAFQSSRLVRTLSPDGHMSVASVGRQRCQGTTWMQIAGDGACVVQRGKRLAVITGGRERWRSVGGYKVEGVFAKLGPRAIAFAYQHRQGRHSSQALVVAPLRGGRERVLEGDEWPLGWTRYGELLTWRYRHGVFLRSAAGSLLHRVAARPAAIRFDSDAKAVFMLLRTGVLARSDGHRLQPLATLHALGLRRGASLELLDGGLLALLEGPRIAVLRQDGRLFASADLGPPGRQVALAANGALAANRAGSTVAFTASRGNSGYRSIGRESVYLLRAGDRRARRIYSQRLRFALCERAAELNWHGEWLLYSATEGTTVAIDTTRPNRRIDLTATAKRVGDGTDEAGKLDVQARWAT